jgi:hypothetical protein
MAPRPQREEGSEYYWSLDIRIMVGGLVRPSSRHFLRLLIQQPTDKEHMAREADGHSDTPDLPGNAAPTCDH